MVREKEILHSEPEYDIDTSITLKFSDGATYIVATMILAATVHLLYTAMKKENIIQK